MEMLGVPSSLPFVSDDERSTTSSQESDKSSVRERAGTVFNAVMGLAAAVSDTAAAVMERLSPRSSPVEGSVDAAPAPVPACTTEVDQPTEPQSPRGEAAGMPKPEEVESEGLELKSLESSEDLPNVADGVLAEEEGGPVELPGESTLPQEPETTPAPRPLFNTTKRDDGGSKDPKPSDEPQEVTTWDAWYGRCFEVKTGCTFLKCVMWALTVLTLGALQGAMYAVASLYDCHREVKPL